MILLLGECPLWEGTEVETANFGKSFHLGNWRARALVRHRNSQSEKKKAHPRARAMLTTGPAEPPMVLVPRPVCRLSHGGSLAFS